jgi:5-methylcytosine-specific restriction endonuclease McrA
MKIRIKVNCTNCNAIVERMPWEIKRSKTFYCDKKCLMDYRRRTDYYKGANSATWNGGIDPFNCDYCGEENIKRQNKNNTHHFCNQVCANKWKSINLSGKNSPKWNQQELKCEECGKLTLKAPSLIKGHAFCDTICWKKWNKGENTYNWKPETADLKRQRTTSRMKKWKKFIKERDEATCVKCNEVKTIMHSHHIHSYKLYPELRYDIYNGVTLCPDCHIELHSIYGKLECDSDSLIEFLDREVA